MQIKISTRHGHLAEPTQQFIREKAQKLLHLFSRLTMIEVTVDLHEERVFFDDTYFRIAVPHTAREALVTGQWDPIAGLLENRDKVDAKIHELGVV